MEIADGGLRCFDEPHWTCVRQATHTQRGEHRAEQFLHNSRDTPSVELLLRSI